MQTFLPDPCYQESARVLDRQRLGKQRVEAKQLLLALGVPVGAHLPKKSSWANHPAARMWKGYELHLCCYAMAICEEWISRGYRDTLFEQFVVAANRCPPCATRGLPPWLGNEDLHASHRSNLLRKLPAHYSQFGWAEPDNLPYVWPGTELAQNIAA